MIKLINLLEIGDSSAQKYDWKFKNEHKDSDAIKLNYEFKTDSNTLYFVNLIITESDVTSLAFEMIVSFGVGTSIIKKVIGDKKPFAQITNKGEIFKVMTTVIDIVKDGIERMNKDNYPIKIVRFHATKEKETSMGYKQSDQRAKLYMAYIKQNIDMVRTISQKGSDIEVILK